MSDQDRDKKRPSRRGRAKSVGQEPSEEKVSGETDVDRPARATKKPSSRKKRAAEGEPTLDESSEVRPPAAEGQPSGEAGQGAAPHSQDALTAEERATSTGPDEARAPSPPADSAELSSPLDQPDESTRVERREDEGEPEPDVAPEADEDVADSGSREEDDLEDDLLEDERDDDLELDPDEEVDTDEPDEDAPLLRHDEYIDPEERAKLEALSEDLEREETEAIVQVSERYEIPFDRLDVDALKVISRLRRFDHEAYLVGGCVRDLLLGLSPKDFDLATSAKPEEIRSAFTNCRLIGRRFRLAHVYFRGGKVIETATFRQNPRQEEETDEEGGDLYLAADNVYGNAEEDARRRDFTINALFYDPKAGKVIDFVGGREDLDAGLIRTVGDPAVRMPEDPVRILRAVRFAAKLGFRIEEATWEAIREHAIEIPRCAPARVTEEILRLLRCGAARGALSLLLEAGALRVLLPPIAEHLESAGQEQETRFFALLDALDEWGHEHGGPPDDAVLLASLLATLFDPEGMPTPRSEALDGLLGNLVRDARLPRRVAERVRLIIGAQRVFAGQKKRRFSSKRFLGQSYIPHAMALYDIRVRALDEDYSQYQRWVSRLREIEGDAPSSADDTNGGPSSRRRRRRRRTGRSGPRSP